MKRMLERVRVASILAGLLAGMAALVGSWDRGSGDAVAQEPKTLVVLEEDEPQTTYPFLARTMSEQRLAELFFDRFFTQSTGGDIDSRVFEEGWAARPPNLSLAVKEGLKFSTGDPVTFSDISFTLNDVFRRGDIGHSVDGWYARMFGDAQQVTPMHGSIRFLKAMPEDGAERYLLTTVLMSRGALVAGGGKADLEGSKRSPVGTGPFHAAQPIESFDEVNLVRNPHREANVRGGEPVGAMRLLYDQDAARQKELMEGGRADIWVSPPSAVLPPFRNQSDRFGIRSYDLMQWWFVAVNHKSTHLASGDVRLALDLAVPRDQLVEKFGGDSARLSSGPFLPGSAWEAADTAPTSGDKAQINKLMSSAGYAMQGGRWTKGDDSILLRLGVQADILDDYNDVVYALTDAWDSAGFQVRVRGIRPGDWRDNVEGGKAADSHDLILGRWNLDREEGAIDLFTVRDRPGRAQRRARGDTDRLSNCLA